MQKRSLGKIRALVFEWGKWRRSEDSLRGLGYKSPSLTPNSSSEGEIYAPLEILMGIDEAVRIMREDKFAGYDLFRERFYYRTQLKECAKHFSVSESKASQVLDHLLSWVDGHIYSRHRSQDTEKL